MPAALYHDANREAFVVAAIVVEGVLAFVFAEVEIIRDDYIALMRAMDDYCVALV
jgi:hypothetical protein